MNWLIAEHEREAYDHDEVAKVTGDYDAQWPRLVLVTAQMKFQLQLRNVVTGVFCTTAIESAQSDKDIAIMKQMHKQRRTCRFWECALKPTN